MAAWKWLVAGIVLTLCGWGFEPRVRAQFGEREPVEDVPPPKPAPSRIVAVTVYRDTALVTRDVDVPAGKGLVEVTVTPLPASTVTRSLYSEGRDGIRVLSTRYRRRAIQGDMRQDVRNKQDQIDTLAREAERLRREIEVASENLRLLTKLEGFTASTLQTVTDKGRLDETAPIALAKYVMETRTTRSAARVELEQKLAANELASELADRQLKELSNGGQRIEADAVIVVDKAVDGPGRVQLSYLVGSAAWSPKYRMRSGGAKDSVHVEYLAEIEQLSGESWDQARLTLSTAQPALSATLPELLPLDLAVIGPGQSVPKAEENAEPDSDENEAGMDETPEAALLANRTRSAYIRNQAQSALNGNDVTAGGALLNQAAAFEQADEILGKDDANEKRSPNPDAEEGPSVTYALRGQFTVPSRRDPQLVEVGRFELAPEYFDKATPVLSPRVFRLANLTNTSEYVLLPGEASMYAGTDFVGRMKLPLVTRGEPFTVGFGVDPEMQIGRRLVKKTHSTQGGNQVHTYEFRIVVRNFGKDQTKLHVWDRLPRAEGESVAVTLASSTPEMSTDPLYQRTSKTENLLRWDLDVPPGTVGEKHMTILYQFKLEYARDVAISYLRSGGLSELPIGGMGGMGGMGGGFRSAPTEP